MKSLLVLLFATAISVSLFAQTDDTNRINPGAQGQNPETDKEFRKNQFLNQYGLTETTLKAKMLSEAVLRSEPSESSTPIDGPVPKNAVVKTFKYFPDQKYWAVEYNGNYGFLPVEVIMPVKEDKTAATQQIDEPPRLKGAIEPVVPDIAREKGIHGTVVVKCFIDVTGNVTDTEIDKSIPELDQAAIDAIRKAKFKPASYKGKPVGVWMLINVNFTLE
jgi:TonB family protein